MKKNRVSVELLQLSKLLAHDPIPQGLKAPVFVHTQMDCNRECVCRTAASLLKTGTASRILIIEDEDGRNKGYSGDRAWSNCLRKNFAVPRGCIERVPLREYINTFSESVAMVRYAQERGITNLITVSTHLQVERAVTSMVSAMGVVGYKLPMYAQVGLHDWYEVATQSTANVPKERLGLVEEEVWRMSEYRKRKYQKTGRLVPVRAVLKYLRSRH